MDELSSLHGILGSNTVGNWLREYQHLRPPKALNAEIMNKHHSPIEERNQHEKKYKTSEQWYIGILKDEFDFGGVFENIQQAKELLEKVVVICNDKRPHWSNHFLTPGEMHRQRVLKIRTWKKDRAS